MKGFGGMVSFETKGGVEATTRFLKTMKVFSLAESLGGAASLAEQPATMSHASMPGDVREQCGSETTSFGSPSGSKTSTTSSRT